MIQRKLDFRNHRQCQFLAELTDGSNSSNLFFTYHQRRSHQWHQYFASDSIGLIFTGSYRCTLCARTPARVKTNHNCIQHKRMTSLPPSYLGGFEDKLQVHLAFKCSTLQDPGLQIQTPLPTAELKCSKKNVSRYIKGVISERNCDNASSEGIRCLFGLSTKLIM